MALLVAATAYTTTNTLTRCTFRRPLPMMMAIKDVEWQKVDAELERAANTVRNTRWVGPLTVSKEGIDEFTSVLVKTKENLAITKDAIETRFAEAEAAAMEAAERAAAAEAAAAAAKEHEKKVLRESKAEAERAIAARDYALSKALAAESAAAAAKAEAAAAAAERDTKAAARQAALEEADRAGRERAEAIARVEIAEAKAAKAAQGESSASARRVPYMDE